MVIIIFSKYNTEFNYYLHVNLAFMLAWPYGFVQIMSSFAFDKAKNWTGPPSNENGDTQDVLFDE